MRCPYCGYQFAVKLDVHHASENWYYCERCYKRERAQEEYIYDLCGERVKMEDRY